MKYIMSKFEKKSKIKQSECPICYEEYLNEDIKNLECGHKFHKKCIVEWCKITLNCPMCRGEIKRSNSLQNINDEMTEEMYEAITRSMREID